MIWYFNSRSENAERDRREPVALARQRTQRRGGGDLVAEQHGIERQRSEARRERERERPTGQRRGGRRRVEKEAEAVEGAVAGAGGELQGAQHSESETKAGVSEAAQPAAEASGSLVPKPTSEDEAEADGGGVRATEEMLRESQRREPAATEGSSGAESAEAFAAALHAYDAADYAHHVPFV